MMQVLEFEPLEPDVPSRFGFISKEHDVVIGHVAADLPGLFLLWELGLCPISTFCPKSR